MVFIGGGGGWWTALSGRHGLFQKLSRQILKNTQSEASKPCKSAKPALAATFSSLQKINPWDLVQPELQALSRNIPQSIASDIPQLHKVASYLFGSPGKRFRPAVVLLVSKALSPVHAHILDSQQKVSEITEVLTA
jgi:hypothetical protein